MITLKALKKGSIFLFLTSLIFLFGFLNIWAVSYKFVWQNTTVTIPLGSSIEDYKSIPYARLYKNGEIMSDANVTYNTEGDWLYYFKDINPYRVGSYPVWYKAYDSKYCPGTCTGYKALINFDVKDLVLPEITIIDDIYLIQRGSEYNLKNNFYAYDNYELKDVLVNDTINKDKAGDYKVTVTAIDSSNNQRIKSFIARVYETTYPEILYDIPANTLEVGLNEEFDIKSLFTATDRVDGDITDKIVFDEFRNDRVEEYDFHIFVTNNANLTTTKTIHIIVADYEMPQIVLETKQIMLDYKTPIYSIDLRALVKEIIDNQEINYDNLEISHNMKNEIGSYMVTYSYSDGYHVVSEDLEVIFLSYDKPLISCGDIHIEKGQTIDILNYATIIDDSDPLILDSVEFLDSNISYDKAGTYYADIYCMNSSGKSSTLRVKVVIDENNIFSNSNMGITIIFIVLIVIILLLSGFIIYYFVIKKFHNKKVA